jgi:hypothetical protein
MAPHDSREVAQPKASFLHTCLLYSPLRKSTSNNPEIFFLPEKGPIQGGTFGAFKCGRQTEKYLLTTKNMGLMEVTNLLKGALSDSREGHTNGISATQCAIQSLLDFDPLEGAYSHTYGREMSEIYVLMYENEFPDTLGVGQYEPGKSCALL